MWEGDNQKAMFIGDASCPVQSILHRRQLSVLIWSFLLQCVPLSIYVLISRFDIFHPIIWLHDSFCITFYIRVWIPLILVQILLAIMGLTIYKKLDQTDMALTSRFQAVVALFSHENILNIILYAVTSGLIVWSYCKINQEYVVSECKTMAGQRCVIEGTVCKLLCGIWVAVYTLLKKHFSLSYNLNVSVIQQSKTSIIKSELYNLLRDSFKSSLSPAVLFLILYYWRGSVALSFVQILVRGQVENTRITSLGAFSSFHLFLNCWLLSSIVVFYIISLHFILQIHFSAKMEFSLTDQYEPLLSTGLKSNSIIVKKLAYFYLYNASKTSTLRSHVFTLSIPGGHPKTWNIICGESLKIITSFTQNLENAMKPPQSNQPVNQRPKHIHLQPALDLHNHFEVDQATTSPFKPKMRNLIENISEFSYKEQLDESDSSSRIRQILAELLNKPGLRYMFSVQPDCQLNHVILTESQCVVFAVESLSSLAAAALIEDQYGIVLKDLSTIVHTLVHFKYVIEKLFKFSNHGYNRKLVKSNDIDTCLKQTLKTALNRSLYKIAIAYGKYLKDLNLSREDYECLAKYVEFKEC